MRLRDLKMHQPHIIISAPDQANASFLALDNTRWSGYLNRYGVSSSQGFPQWLLAEGPAIMFPCERESNRASSFSKIIVPECAVFRRGVRGSCSVCVGYIDTHLTPVQYIPFHCAHCCQEACAPSGIVKESRNQRKSNAYNHQHAAHGDSPSHACHPRSGC